VHEGRWYQGAPLRWIQCRCHYGSSYGGQRHARRDRRDHVKGFEGTTYGRLVDNQLLMMANQLELSFLDGLVVSLPTYEATVPGFNLGEAICAG